MDKTSLCRSGYMIYPNFLFKTEISDTAKLVYILLLNRSRMSETREEYTDKNGRSFVFYTTGALAEDIRRSRSTVRDALSALEGEGLIERHSQGRGYANLIYVNIPAEEENSRSENPSRSGAKNFSQGAQNSGGDCTEKPAQGTPENRQGVVQNTGVGYNRKPAPNKIYNNKNNNKKEFSKRERERASPRGRYKNVLISDEEYLSLKDSYRKVDEYIEKLSRYIRTRGKKYACHDAILRGWLEEDGHMKQFINYDHCKEEELWT